MNKELLASAGIDYDEGVRRFMGNALLFEKMLCKFLTDQSFSEAQKSFESCEWQSFMRNVHTLKGLSGNLSINVIYHTASQIVSLLRADDIEGAKALFPSLEEEYGAVSKAIGLAAEADRR